MEQIDGVHVAANGLARVKQVADPVDCGERSRRALIVREDVA
jgi:hypothetical protein